MTAVLAPLKRFAGVSYGLGQPPTLVEEGIPILRATNVERGRINPKGLVYANRADLPLDRCPLLSAGEILVVRSGAYTGDSALVTDQWAGSAPGYDLRLTPHASIEPRYLAYSLLSSRSIREMKVLSSRAAQPHLNAEELGEVLVIVPPLAKQRAVADYLDAETGRIDALTAKKQQLLQLIEERLHCAADGIVEGLLDRANLAPLKYLVHESDERLGPEGEAQVLSVSIHHGVVPRSELDDRESRADDFSLYKLCMPGQIVLNRMRAFQGGLGVVRHPGIVSPDYTVITPSDRLRPEFLHFLMRSQWFVGQMVQRLRGIGSTDQGAVRTPRVNYADLGLIEIPVPSAVEQEEISRGLLRSTGRVAQTRATLRRQLDLLAERRQALITAAVTSEVSKLGAL